MAKVSLSLGVNGISGSIKGSTWQKWKGMQTVRGKPIPTQPDTPRVTLIRSLVSTISKAWRDVLNQGQRIAWGQFADNFPWFNVFGDAIILDGNNLFLKINLVLLDHSRAMQVNPPPAVEPPDLTDVTVLDDPGGLDISVPQLVTGMITAQAPFLDVWVAGGFTAAQSSEDNDRYAEQIDSLCLPQGRKAQKSDYRHVIYLDDKAIVEPAVDPSQIRVTPPETHVKNISVRIQRYNQYGRYTVPIVLEGIRTGD